VQVSDACAQDAIFWSVLPRGAQFRQILFGGHRYGKAQLLPIDAQCFTCFIESLALWLLQCQDNNR